MIGIDYTASTTATQAKALKDAGYGFVCRYLVPIRMAWKRLTKSEADIISVAGLQIISIYEASANNAAKGAVQGTIDGKEALMEAKAVCQPQGNTIYFAVDYDAQAKDYDIIEAYLKAAQAQIIGYNVGCYGSFGVCEEMSKRGIEYCWQTYAWSSGKKSTYANVYQYKNGVNICGISCDANESYGNEGFWNLNEETSSAISTPQAIGNGNTQCIGTGIVNTNGLNIRNNSDANSTILGQFTTGDKIWFYENNNGWLRIYADKNGWVKLDYINIDMSEEVIDMFKDFDQVAEYAKTAVQKAEAKGAFVGDENRNFNPKTPISRQDFAVVLDRLGLLG